MTTPYFAFCKDERPKVTEFLKTKAITEVAKELGRRWKALSDEEKAKFKAIAAENKKNRPVPIVSDSKGTKRRSEFNLPLQKIKRIALLGKEDNVKHLSKDSLKALTLSTELFLQLLARTCKKFTKSKTIKMEEVLKGIHYGDTKYHFLRHDFLTPEKYLKEKKALTKAEGQNKLNVG